MNTIKTISFLLFFVVLSACGQQPSVQQQTEFSTYATYEGQQNPREGVGGGGYVDDVDGEVIVGEAVIAGPRGEPVRVDEDDNEDDNEDDDEEVEESDDDDEEVEESDDEDEAEDSEEEEELEDPNEDIEFDEEWLEWEMEVLRLTNVVRQRGANCGGTQMPPVDPVEPHIILRNAAYLHSKDMADKNYFSHTGQDGRSPFQRIADAGWTGSRMQGENIAAGQRSPQQAVDGWEQSPGHCRNMMNGAFNYLGVGYATGGGYGHYWTQNFSQ